VLSRGTDKPASSLFQRRFSSLSAFSAQVISRCRRSWPSSTTPCSPFYFAESQALNARFYRSTIRGDPVGLGIRAAARAAGFRQRATALQTSVAAVFFFACLGSSERDRGSACFSQKRAGAVWIRQKRADRLRSRSNPVRACANDTQLVQSFKPRACQTVTAGTEA